MSDKPLIEDLALSTEFDAAPRRPPGRPPGAKTKKPVPPYRQGALIEPLEKMYGALALGLMPFAPLTARSILSDVEVTLEDNSTVVRSNAENIAHAWDEWAKTSPAVRRLLYPLLNVAGGAKVVAAHLPILMAVALETGLVSKLLSHGVGEQAEEFVRRMTTVDNDD